MENILENIQILKKKCLFLVTVVKCNLNLINCFFLFIVNLNIIKLLKYRIEEKQNITSPCEWSSDFELTNMCTPG